MGEAKQRAHGPLLIYHHTSTLRTNELWMRGEILPEGQVPPATHPQLGEIHTNAFFRRPMKDFPPVVWLTEEISVPRCLVQTALRFVRQDSGEEVGQVDIGEGLANAIALNRVSLGFHPADIRAVRWPDHPGYYTGEGQELNESAREVDDDPDRWWVSEQPVDLLQAVEVRISRSVSKPKMERSDQYLKEVRRMVELCRTEEGVYIPPSWLKPEQAARIAREVGLPIRPR